MTGASLPDLQDISSREQKTHQVPSTKNTQNPTPKRNALGLWKPGARETREEKADFPVVTEVGWPRSKRFHAKGNGFFHLELSGLLSRRSTVKIRRFSHIQI